MNNKKRHIIISVFVAVVTMLLSFITVFAIEWDGSTGATGGSAGSASNPNGYAIRYTSVVIGYRFSLVDNNGNTTRSPIDIYCNGYTNYISGEKRFSPKLNKCQILKNYPSINSYPSNPTTTSTANVFAESNMGFATSLPTSTDNLSNKMNSWQDNTSNLNRISMRFGYDSVFDTPYGYKYIVEPLFSVRLQGIYHSLTVTEMAAYGAKMFGASAGTSGSDNEASWGFISRYTNWYFANSLFTPNGQGLWGSASALSARTTFDTLIKKGYGVGIAYSSTVGPVSITYHPNGGTINGNAYQTYPRGTNITLANVVRTGYHLISGVWKTSSGGTIGAPNGKYVLNDHVHAYANWEINKLNVQYNTNGGTVSSTTYGMNSSGFVLQNGAIYNEKWTYNDPKPYGLTDYTTFGMSRSGYKFIGWCKTPTKSGTVYSQSDNTIKPTDLFPGITSTDSGTVVLYAIWEPTYVNVRFDVNHDDLPSNWFNIDETVMDSNTFTVESDENASTITLNGDLKKGATKAIGVVRKNVIPDEGKKYYIKLEYVSGSFTEDGYPRLVTDGQVDGHRPTTREFVDVMFPNSTNLVRSSKIELTSACNEIMFELYASGVTTFDNYKVRVTVTESNVETGTILPMSKNILVNGTYGELRKASRDGYQNLNQWYDSKTFATEITSKTPMTRLDNHVLYAKWTPAIIDIKYNAAAMEAFITEEKAGLYKINKNVSSDNTTSGLLDITDTNNISIKESFLYTDENLIKTIKDDEVFGLRMKHYNFKGWTFVSSDKKSTVFFAKNELQNIDFENVLPKNSLGNTVGTLYAEWEPYEYDVVYCGNGATNETYDEEVTPCSAETCNCGISSIGNLKDPRRFKYDYSANLIVNKFSRRGYTFIGWSLTPDGDALFKDAERVSNLTEIDNDTVYLYAKWKPNTLTVQYNSNGVVLKSDVYTTDTAYMIKTIAPNEYYKELYTGENLDDNIIFSTNAKFGISKTGYDYNGWVVTGDCANNYKNAMVDENNTTIKIIEICPQLEFEDCTIVLYSDNSPLPYTLKYNANRPDTEGTGVMTNGAVKNGVEVDECIFGQDYNLKENLFTRDYYHFTGWTAYSEEYNKYYGYKNSVRGWYTSSEIDEYKVFADKEVFMDLVYPVGNSDFETVTMLAQWETNKFNVRYNANGGTVSNGYTISSSGFIKLGSSYNIQTWTVESAESTINIMSNTDFSLINSTKVFSYWDKNNSNTPVNPGATIEPRVEYPEIKTQDVTVDMYATWKSYHQLTVQYNAGTGAYIASSVYIVDSDNNIYDDVNKNGIFDEGIDTIYQEKYQAATFMTKSSDIFGMGCTRKMFAFWTMSSAKTINAKSSYLSNETVNIAELCPNIFEEDYTITLTANWENASKKQIKVYYLAPGAEISDECSEMFTLKADDFIYNTASDAKYIETYQYSALVNRQIFASSASAFGIEKSGSNFRYWKIRNCTQESLNGRVNVSSINTSELASVFLSNDICEIYLEAVWEPNKLIIHYDTNGGSISPMNTDFYAINGLIYNSNDTIYTETVPYNNSHRISDNSAFNMNRPGYKLVGWKNTTTNDDYDLGSTHVASEMAPGVGDHDMTITLSAIWVPNTLKVYYNVNGGTLNSGLYSVDSSGNITLDGEKYYDYVEYEKLITYMIQSPTKFGLYRQYFLFDNWFDDNTKIRVANTTIRVEDMVPEILLGDCEITLYAAWAPDKEGEKAIRVEYYEGEIVSKEVFIDDIITKVTGATAIDAEPINYVNKQISGNAVTADEANYDNGIYTYYYEINPDSRTESSFVFYRNKDTSKANAGTLVVKYNNPPVIEATDRWFTLAEAKAGKITELELLSTATANDIEDGDITEKLKIVDFGSLEFNSVGTVKVTYTVTDQYRKTTTKDILVHIINTYEHEKTRFISQKYYPRLESNLKMDANGNYVTRMLNGTLYYLKNNGDIATINGVPYRVDAGPKVTIVLNSDRTYTVIPTSKWLSDAYCVNALTNCLRNSKNNSGNWLYSEETWKYTSQELKEIKTNIKNNGYDPSFYTNRRINNNCVEFANSLIDMNDLFSPD